MSPKVAEEHRLPPIPEEPFTNDMPPSEQDTANATALSQNIDNVLPPASVPPVTMDENDQPPPPPYPGQVVTSISYVRCFCM